MSKFKIIESKSDVSRYEKFRKMSESESFLSSHAKKIVADAIEDYKTQQVINKWVEEHYDERVDVKDENNFSIPFRCIDKNGIVDSKLHICYRRENYVDEWRNVGTEHHWIYATTNLPSFERLDWNPQVLADILTNQDNLERLYDEYKLVGLIF